MAIAQPVSNHAEWWQAEGDWVEPPNVRRSGESGVQRLQRDGRSLYLKRQAGHLYRSLRYPFGRPTVLRESHALAAFERLGVRVPETVYVGAQRSSEGNWLALLVTAELEGFVDLDRWYAEGRVARQGAQWHDAMLQQLALMLVRVHRGGWQHGCLYGKHVFVRAGEQGPELALLDLEKCRRRFSAQRAAFNDLDQLRRHSSLERSDWERLVYFYETAFGKPIRGLQR